MALQKSNLEEISEFYGGSGLFGKIRQAIRLGLDYIISSIASVFPSNRVRVFLHKLRGVKIGKNVSINRGVHIDNLYPSLIVIEDNVTVGFRSIILAHSNPTSSEEIKKKYYPRLVKKTTLKKGSWIGLGAIVLPGISVGENSVVGAGAVVTKDVPEYNVVAGNPAKMIKRLR